MTYRTASSAAERWIDRESPGQAPQSLRHQAFGFHRILGESPAIEEAIERALRAAATRATVLLVGETGTGKELFARGIHQEGARRSEPFVAVNCAAIPESLLESELFGYEPGAFTGAQKRKQGLIEIAAGGTLFLDEIGELPLHLQPKLLRVIQERQFRRVGGVELIEANCRIIAATNVEMELAVDRGEFRADLWYRLDVIRVPIPPLRERGADLELIAGHILDEVVSEHGLSSKRFGSRALEVLRAYSWPGNIRELMNVVESAAVTCDAEEIGAQHILVKRRTRMPAPWSEPALGGEIRIPPSGKTLAEIQEEAAHLTLRLMDNNKSATARALGISRPTLARILKRRENSGVARRRGLAVVAGR